jgi:hypothetical protein
MTVPELLDEVEARDIILVVDSDNLRCQGEESALTAELIGALREHKAEIISLMQCGWCGTLLSGPLNEWWRVLDNGQCTYLCSASCVFEAWPWRMDGGGHDHGH